MGVTGNAGRTAIRKIEDGKSYQSNPSAEEDESAISKYYSVFMERQREQMRDRIHIQSSMVTDNAVLNNEMNKHEFLFIIIRNLIRLLDYSIEFYNDEYQPYLCRCFRQGDFKNESIMKHLFSSRPLKVYCLLFYSLPLWTSADRVRIKIFSFIKRGLPILSHYFCHPLLSAMTQSLSEV